MPAMLDVLRPRDPARHLRRRRLPRLYQYDDPLTGRRFMGCLHKVFATEIDVALFEEAERTRAGYGARQARRRAAARAATSRSSRRIDWQRARTTPASNRRFFDWPDGGRDAVRAFDLRDGLHE